MFPHPRYDFLDDTGSVSVESALLMMFFASLAAALIVIARSDPIRESLTDLIQRALDVSG